MVLRTGVLALTGVAALVCVSLASETAPRAADSAAVVSWAGSFSGIKMPRAERVVDAKSWEAIWREHRGTTIEKNANGFETWPAIDFDRYMVIALFGGPSNNSNGWFLRSWGEREGHLLIRCEQQRFQTASFDPGPSGIPTLDFGFFVLPRTSREIIIEENTQNLIGKPPIWTEKLRFPALTP